MKRVLITGSAGFIGFHLSQYYLIKGWKVFGIDSFTSYYDVKLKRRRSKILEKNKHFTLEEFCLTKRSKVTRACCNFKPNLIIHLAAQAGVRYSIENPQAYVDCNIIGTFNLLEAAKKINCEHTLIASTSSVYGANLKTPYREIDKTDHQLSFYAATKKSVEVMSHTYAHLFKLPITCFRFFTVYGPWGRPDMAPIIFVSRIADKKPINIFNRGKMKRDFTYIDDLVEGIYRLSNQKPRIEMLLKHKIKNDSLSPVAPWRVVNIGRGEPFGLMEFIEIIEEKLGIKAEKNFVALGKGEVVETYADNSLLKALTGYHPKTSLPYGVEQLVGWYIEYSKSERILS